MIDFPGIPGKMCDWEKVAAVDGAKETLKALSVNSKLYIATGAAQSTVSEIEAAFSRVGLSRYLSGYFCKANLGIEKGSPDFFRHILLQLGKRPEDVIVVGDSLNKDIIPAMAAGINAVWLSREKAAAVPKNIRVIRSLKELC